MVEQLTLNQLVYGSSPYRGTISKPAAFAAGFVVYACSLIPLGRMAHRASRALCPPIKLLASRLGQSIITPLYFKPPGLKFPALPV